MTTHAQAPTRPVRSKRSPGWVPFATAAAWVISLALAEYALRHRPRARTARRATGLVSRA